MASDLQHGDGNATLRRVSLGWMSSARRCTTIWPLFGPGKQWMFCARRCLLTLPFSIRTDPCRTQSPLKLFYKIQWISYGSIGFNGIRHTAMYGNMQQNTARNLFLQQHPLHVIRKPPFVKQPRLRHVNHNVCILVGSCAPLGRIVPSLIRLGRVTS